MFGRMGFDNLLVIIVFATLNIALLGLLVAFASRPAQTRRFLAGLIRRAKKPREHHTDSGNAH